MSVIVELIERLESSVDDGEPAILCEYMVQIVERRIVNDPDQLIIRKREDQDLIRTAQPQQTIMKGATCEAFVDYAQLRLWWLTDKPWLKR